MKDRDERYLNVVADGDLNHVVYREGVGVVVVGNSLKVVPKERERQRKVGTFHPSSGGEMQMVDLAASAESL